MQERAQVKLKDIFPDFLDHDAVASKCQKQVKDLKTLSRRGYEVDDEEKSKNSNVSSQRQKPALARGETKSHSQKKIIR